MKDKTRNIARQFRKKKSPWISNYYKPDFCFNSRCANFVVVLLFGKLFIFLVKKPKYFYKTTIVSWVILLLHMSSDSMYKFFANSSSFCSFFLMSIKKQEGQRCPKRRVAQAAIRLATAVITFRNKERNVTSPS